MDALIKFVIIAIITQIALIATVVLATRGSAFVVVINFYYPMIFVIIKLGGFTGESTMMLPVFLGIPLGIFLYGLIFGLLVKWIRASRLLKN